LLDFLVGFSQRGQDGMDSVIANMSSMFSIALMNVLCARHKFVVLSWPQSHWRTKVWST
jgi:hypothetical protein